MFTINENSLSRSILAIDYQVSSSPPKSPSHPLTSIAIVTIVHTCDHYSCILGFKCIKTNYLTFVITIHSYTIEPIHMHVKMSIQAFVKFSYHVQSSRAGNYDNKIENNPQSNTPPNTHSVRTWELHRSIL